MEPIRPKNFPTPIKIDHDFILRHLCILIERAEKKYDQNNLPPEKYLHKYCNLEGISEPLEAACEAANRDAGAEALREWFKQHDRDISRLKERFQERLLEEEEGKWPKIWMLKDRKIAAMLKGCRFADTLNYLWGISTKALSEELEQFVPEDMRKVPGTIKSGRSKWAWEWRDLVLLKVDARKMAANLGMSPALAQKYLQSFAMAGVLIDLCCRAGEHGLKIYAIGTWLRYRDGHRRNPFMMDTPEWRKRLREFHLEGGKQKMTLASAILKPFWGGNITTYSSFMERRAERSRK